MLKQYLDTISLYRQLKHGIKKINCAPGQEITTRLIEHLDPILLKPQTILNISLYPKATNKLLQSYYRKAHIINLHPLPQMLEPKNFMERLQPRKAVCATVMDLPFAPQSFDLVFSSLWLPYCLDLNKSLVAIRRSLKPNGLFLFATLGPDSLQELKDAWLQIDNYPHIHPLTDMHDIGDALVSSYFLEPVMEMEKLTLSYNSPQSLLKDLRAMGIYNCQQDRFPALTGKSRFAKFITALNHLTITIEIIYGHAWVPKVAT